MIKIVHGVIRGNTIELDERLGVAEGQQVEVQVKVVEAARKWGEGILRSAGVLADDADWDPIMEEIHQNRKLERRPQIEDVYAEDVAAIHTSIQDFKSGERGTVAGEHAAQLRREFGVSDE